MSAAAALRLEALTEFGPTELPPPFAARVGRCRPACAHAEAAALRWSEQHCDEPR